MELGRAPVPEGGGVGHLFHLLNGWDGGGGVRWCCWGRRGRAENEEVWSSLEKSPTFSKCLLGPVEHDGDDPVIRTAGPTAPALEDARLKRDRWKR